MIRAAILSLALAPIAAAAEDCALIEARVKFCGDPAVWTDHSTENEEIAAVYKQGLTFRAQYLVGELGSAGDMTEASVINFQRENYASFTEVDVKNLPLIFEDRISVGDHRGQRAAFAIDFQGDPFIVAVSALVFDDFNLQIMTLENEGRFSEDHLAKHNDLLSLTEIAPDGDWPE